MPVQVSYPGVYVQEIPTSNPTVIAVTTSSTAFVDFFPSGPLGQAVQINSWNAFQQTFGGLDARSESSYAILQYFLNGGQVAWVIRVVDPASVTASPLGVLAVSLAPAAASGSTGTGTAGADTSGTPGTGTSGTDTSGTDTSGTSGTGTGEASGTGTSGTSGTATSETTLATGATVLGGSTLEASWSVAPADSIAPVSYAVYLSTDGGISFNPAQQNSDAKPPTSPTLGTNLAASPTTFNVSIPQVMQPAQGVVQVVASDANGNLLASATSPQFTIVPGEVTVTVLSTVSGVQTSGTTVNLRWSWQGNVTPSYYSVLLSTDGGSTFTAATFVSPAPPLPLAGTVAAADVTLPVPATYSGQGTAIFQVTATDVNGNPIASAQTAPIQVAQTVVAVESIPNGAAEAGTPLSLTWTSTGGATVTSYNVFLSTNGGQTFPSTPANGSTPITGTNSYSLTTLPTTVAAPQQAAVQVVALGANGNQLGNGVAPFAILPAETSTIAISAPTAGADENPGFTVTWAAPTPAPTETVASYNVLLSTNGGATFQTVPGLSLAASGTTSPPTTATITQLPAGASTPTSQAVVQVTALDASGNLLGLGQSDVFSIAGTATTPPVTPPATTPPQFVIRAISPGAWGNALQVSLTPNSGATSFNLAVQQVVSGTTVASESYTGLTYGDPTDPYYAPSILAASNLIQLAPYPATFPGRPLSVPAGAFSSQLAGGTDGAVVDLESAANALGTAFGVSNPLGALDNIAPSVFNLLCLPWLANLSGGAEFSIATQAMTFCGQRQAFYIMDIPVSVSTPALMQTWADDYISASNYYAAVYFPRLIIADPLNNYRPRNCPASGTLAGVYALNDTNAGVWVAPAGVDAVLQGIMGLAYNLTDTENGTLNPLGINCLRTFPVYNNIVWGARTLAGADQIESEWKYIPVRRLIDYIEQSLVQSLKWAVFQPNGPQLWTQISVEVGTFLSGLYSQGALYGATPSQAYFVNCDSTTTTPTDIAQGIVNIVVGVAPVDPAEFVILTIQQIAGQTQSS